MAYLVTINDLDEETWLDLTFNDGQSRIGADMWIDFNDRDQEGTRVWLNGDPVAYTNWYSQEPNDGGDGPDGTSEDAAVMNYFRESGGWWNDRPVEQIFPAIVEKPPRQNRQLPRRPRESNGRILSGGSGYDEGSWVVETSDGGYVVVGRTSSTGAKISQNM